MPAKRYRAPEEYGAYVDGVYFQPGQLLPAGTSEYVVTAVENLTGTQHGWRTVHAIFDVGTSHEEIEEEIYGLFEDLSEDYGVGDI